MVTINRLIVSLAAIVVIALAVVVILVTVGVLEYWFLPWDLTETESASSLFGLELRWLAQLGLLGQTISVAASLAVIVLMLGLLAFETMGATRRRETPLLISSTGLGLLSVEPASIRTLVEHTGSANRSVFDLRCRLNVRRKTPPGGPDHIIISCQPNLEMGADLTEVRDDLQARVKEVVERLTGLAVERVHITRVRYERLPEHRLID